MEDEEEEEEGGREGGGEEGGSTEGKVDGSVGNLMIRSCGIPGIFLADSSRLSFM